MVVTFGNPISENNEEFWGSESRNAAHFIHGNTKQSKDFSTSHTQQSPWIANLFLYFSDFPMGKHCINQMGKYRPPTHTHTHLRTKLNLRDQIILLECLEGQANKIHFRFKFG